jgi:rhodanese-related sulfurtransferase
MCFHTFSESKRTHNDDSIGYQPNGDVIGKTILQPLHLCAVRLKALHDVGAMLIDTRSPIEFAAGHLPGSINLPFARRTFPTYAIAFLENTTPFYLLINSADVDDAITDLRLIGLDQVTGYFEPQAMEEWSMLTGEMLETLDMIDAQTVARQIRQGEVTVIDVRTASEYAAGNLPCARNIALNHLLERIAEVPTDRPVILYCKSGLRSTIAASLLREQGRTNLFNLQGGFQAWSDAALPVIDRSMPSTMIKHRRPTTPIPARRPLQPQTAYEYDVTTLPYWMEFSPQQASQLVTNRKP